MYVAEKNSVISLFQKPLTWFDTNFSSAYTKMASTGIGSKIIGLAQGCLIFYLYINYLFLMFLWPILLCSFIFDIGSKDSYIPKLMFAAILAFGIWNLYKKYYFPQKQKFISSITLSQEDSNWLKMIQAFFGINAIAGLAIGLNSSIDNILAIIIGLDFVIFLYLAKSIKSFLIIVLFFAIGCLFALTDAKQLANMSSTFLLLYALYILMKNFTKFMYVISLHKIFFQWSILLMPIIFGISFCHIGKELFIYRLIGGSLIFIGYYVVEYFIMKSYEDGVKVKSFLERFCGVPVIFFTLCIALVSIYNKMQDNNNDSDIIYNEHTEYIHDNVENDSYMISDNDTSISNDVFNNSSYGNSINNYSGPVFPNGFETSALTGLGAFSAGNTLDFGGATIDTTIDIPEFNTNPYMLFTTHPTTGNFNIADANGITQVSVVDGNVYDATHTLVGGLNHNDVTGITTLNSTSNETVMSWDTQNNIYAGTPETGHLIGRVDKGVAANTLRDISGGIVSYTDALGNAYGANGTPLGSVRKI